MQFLLTFYIYFSSSSLLIPQTRSDYWSRYPIISQSDLVINYHSIQQIESVRILSDILESGSNLGKPWSDLNSTSLRSIWNVFISWKNTKLKEVFCILETEIPQHDRRVLKQSFYVCWWNSTWKSVSLYQPPQEESILCPICIRGSARKKDQSDDVLSELNKPSSLMQKQIKS